MVVRKEAIFLRQGSQAKAIDGAGNDVSSIFVEVILFFQACVFGLLLRVAREIVLTVVP